MTNRILLWSKLFVLSSTRHVDASAQAARFSLKFSGCRKLSCFVVVPIFFVLFGLHPSTASASATNPGTLSLRSPQNFDGQPSSFTSLRGKSPVGQSGVFVSPLSRGEMDLSYLGWWVEKSKPKKVAQIDPKTGLPPPMSAKSVPPVEWPLVLLQGFSGMVVGAFGSFMMQALIDLALAPTITDQASFETSGLISNLATLLVMPWVIGGTVYGLGQLSNNYTSSFWWALIGAYVGQGVAFTVGLLLNYLDTTEGQPTSRLIRFLLDGLLIGIGSVLFYTLFRRSRGTFQQIGSLMHFRNGQMVWGLPLPVVSQPQPGETSVSVPILTGTF